MKDFDWNSFRKPLNRECNVINVITPGGKIIDKKKFEEIVNNRRKLQMTEDNYTRDLILCIVAVGFLLVGLIIGWSIGVMP